MFCFSVTFHPRLVTAQIQERIISLWGGYFSSSAYQPKFSLSQPPAPITTLFSIRNLGLLSKSQNPSQTWDKFEHFVGRLLTSSILHPFVLEDQCMSLLRRDNQQELSDDISRRLGSCLKGVIDSWKIQNVQKNQGNYPDFGEEFLEWFAWLFSKLNNIDDFDDSLENFPELTIN